MFKNLEQSTIGKHPKLFGAFPRPGAMKSLIRPFCETIAAYSTQSRAGLGYGPAGWEPENDVKNFPICNCKARRILDHSQKSAKFGALKGQDTLDQSLRHTHLIHAQQ